MFITAMGSQSRKKTIIIRAIAILVMSVIFLTSAFSVAALSKTALISVDDQSLTITTMSTDVNSILEQAGVSVGEADEVISDSDRSTIYIDVLRAFDVVLNADGQEQSYSFAQGTVADVLDKANIQLGADYQVVPSQNTELTPNMVITVSHFQNIILTVDGKTETSSVPDGTVEEALKYLNIAVGSDDKLNVKLTDMVTANMTIEITRVEYKEVEETEEIDFETVKENSTDIEIGQTKTETEGVKGEKTITKRQTLVNGKVTEEEVIKEEITKEPVDAKVLVGAKEASSAAASDTYSNEANSSGNDTTTSAGVSHVNSSGSGNASGESGPGIPEYVKDGVLYDCNGDAVSFSTVYHGSGTAYYADADSLTASGNQVRVGGVAVNSNLIPLGTKLFVVADDGFVYGYSTAIDTGGALFSGSAIVDVFYYTLEDCTVFGRRDVNVYVLN